MEKRFLGRTGLSVSVIGMGCEGFEGKNAEESKRLIDAAIQNGINFFDMYTSNPDVRKNMGAALGIYPRNSFAVQGHLCSTWKDGQYVRTRQLDEVKSAFESFLSLTGFGYADVGMIHYSDEMQDYQKIVNGEILEYAKCLKEQGKIKCIGISTHNTDVALAAAELGDIDVIMFSINPAYDMLPASEDVNVLFEKETFDRQYTGIDLKRESLYSLCQKNDVALTVMKAFAGGLLFDESQSPFGKKMTVLQCLHYCLTRPAVASVMSGLKTVEEVALAAAYCSATDAQKDYGDILASVPNSSFNGHCMYCGHCAPCSVKIDIASVNKYLDLAQAQGFLPETLREHYNLLSHHGGECIACGKCEKNCPFGVNIIEKMQQAKELFGK